MADPTGTNTNPNITAGGDLSGTFPNPTVAKTGGVAFGAAATALVGQIPGSATNDNASAGNIGEFTSGSLASTSALALSTGVGTSVCSTGLSAGDWDVWGQAFFHPGAAAAVTVLTAALSTTAGSSAAGIPALTLGQTAQLGLGAGLTGGSDSGLSIPLVRISLGAAATAFVNAVGTFTSTCAVYGVIQARRRR